MEEIFLLDQISFQDSHWIAEGNQVSVETSETADKKAMKFYQ
jgi:translation initiation factor IF-1